MSVVRSAEDRRWEHRAMAWLAYPANLAFAGVAAFLLALPVVTWLVAWVAAGMALHGWMADDDDRVFTATFRHFAAVWRRLLALSVLATVVAAVLVVNLIFLGSRDTPVAFLLGMATPPFAAAFILVVVLLPAVAAQDPGGTVRAWLRAAAVLAVRRPLASGGLLAIVVAFGLTCVLLPTVTPFLGISVPVWLGLVTARRGPHR